MPQDLGPKKMKLKRGDIHVRARGDVTAVVWRDKGDVYMLMNIHNPPAESNFSDEQGNAIKQLIMEDYNHHIGYVYKGDRPKLLNQPSHMEMDQEAVFPSARCGYSEQVHSSFFMWWKENFT
jgi:hypothetical protein